MKLPLRIRLSAMLFAMMIIALVLGLYAQKREQARLRAALAIYRDPVTEAIFDAVDEPLALNYTDGASLEDVLKETKRRTTGGPRLKSGIPIYVDPIGLQEVEHSMTSPVRRPAAADKLNLGEHLRIALDSLGLGYVVKDGFLMVTSKASLDVETGDEINPYVKYRDLLR